MGENLLDVLNGNNSGYLQLPRPTDSGLLAYQDRTTSTERRRSTVRQFSCFGVTRRVMPTDKVGLGACSGYSDTLLERNQSTAYRPADGIGPVRRAKLS